MRQVPADRIAVLNRAPLNPQGDYVLYWMIAQRRVGWNFALQLAATRARELAKPLLIFEPLRCDYPWASDRLHAFILQGMADNQRRLASRPASYLPYVEPRPGAGKGLLAALAARACLVVSDYFPCFFLPRMVRAAAGYLPVRLEQVDSCGLLPLAASERAFATAYSFRRHLQKMLPNHLAALPQADPLARAGLPRLKGLPADIAGRWPPAPADAIKNPDLARLPIDHSLAPISPRGGATAARRALGRFLTGKLSRYDAERNQPQKEATSGLSPWLHFGHLSPHEVLQRLLAEQERRHDGLWPRATGSRSGWWGLTPAAEEFLDQLVTWRELSFNFCHHRQDYDHYGSLPDWARATLAAHAGDRRPHIYSFDQFDAAQTHDRLWNAAQNQLRDQGRMHGYLRMLWGKKILEWSRRPPQALATMLELNNRYALDGRDPNSYCGIFWCLGRFDRPWPERPVFGKVRYMSSKNTARKVAVGRYMDRFAPQG